MDKGAKSMANFPGEKITEGLDGLRERLAEYRKLGARFAKWRAVITMATGFPPHVHRRTRRRWRVTRRFVRKVIWCRSSSRKCSWTAHTQWNGTSKSRSKPCEAFSILYGHRVVLEGILLKPNMVLSGKESPKQASVQEVAEATVRCLKRVVPAAVPGIVFLSGGQTDQQATEHL